MGYRFDVFDNNVYSDDFLGGRFIHVEIKSTKVSIFMPISSEQAFHLRNTSNRFQFSICKYAKTVNYWSSYALVDGSLESRTPC